MRFFISNILWYAFVANKNCEKRMDKIYLYLLIWYMERVWLL